MLNLLSNALKFTSKGSITVSGALVAEGSPEERLEVRVTDTGVGISEESQKNLFKLFGRLEESKNENRTGCGLGLTICQKIVGKLGGTIELRSRRHVGTTVVFTMRTSCTEAYQVLADDLSEEERSVRRRHIRRASKNIFEEI